jgi:hypothetical protein
MKRSRFLWTQAILWLFILLVFMLSPAKAVSAAAPSQAQTVQALEDALFAVHYDQEPIESRLNRLEQTVFGQPQTGSVEARLAKIQKVLSPNSLGPLSPTAKPSDVASTSGETTGKPAPKPVSQGTISHGSRNQSSQPVADATDYPTVTQMEQKVFGKTFQQEDITSRLARLEKQVFNVTQNGSLADRVDNLRLVVLGDVPASAPPNIAYIPGGYSYPSGGSQFPTSPSGTYESAPPYPGSNIPYPVNPGDPMAYGAGAPTPDMIAAIGQIEKQVIGQQFPMEPFGSRLDRLETKIFHSTSPELSFEDRMQRIVAVASAGGAPESPSTQAKHVFQSLLPIILTILPLILL